MCTRKTYAAQSTYPRRSPSKTDYPAIGLRQLRDYLLTPTYRIELYVFMRKAQIVIPAFLRT